MNPELNLNATDSLFVACLRASPCSETAVKLRELPADRWSDLLELASRQRVGPLLFHSLQSRHALEGIPSAVQEQWRALYRANAVRNLCLSGELGAVLKALQQKGVTVIVLKGAWLAAAVYPHPAERFMYDIDILVSKPDLPATVQVLKELGYASYIHCTTQECFETSHHWPRLFKPGAVAGIEVHWNLTEPGETWSIDPDEPWERAVPATLTDGNALSLCPEDALLHLCLHLTHAHLMDKGISPLCDIDRTARRFQESVDWSLVIQRARSRGWERGTHLAFHLARQLLQTPVPPHVIRELEPAGFSPAIAQAAVEHLLADNRPGESISFAFTLFFQERSPLKKARLFLSSLFPAPRVLAPELGVPSNSPRIYLHYPARLKYLVGHYGRKWLRLRLHGDSPEHREMAALADRKKTLEEWLHAK